MRIEGEIRVGAKSVAIDPIDLSGFPLVLARAHRQGEVGEPLTVKVRVDGKGDEATDGQTVPSLDDIVRGAGFEVDSRKNHSGSARSLHTLTATRLRSLPDYVAPHMSVLICGLNPSLHSADMKVGFGRGGNRFWPAALAAGLVEIDRDPIDALASHGIGMTDLVKRATPRAASLTTVEYADGVRRLETLCGWLHPRVVCMVGLAGWRAAVDRGAGAGVQSRGLGGSLVYVMPSTSGLNARSSLGDLTDHLRQAAELADEPFN